MYLWISRAEVGSLGKGGVPRGVLELFFDGVYGPRSEPLPISKNFYAQKTADLTFFPRNFCKLELISKG